MNRVTLHLGLACLCALACSPLSGGCSRSHAAPNRTVDRPAALSIADIPIASVEFVRFETDEDSFEVVVRFTNHGTVPLSYSGYNFDPGAPKLYMEFWSEISREWGDRIRNPCGVGMETYTIAPRQSVEARQRFSGPHKRRFRVGVYYSVPGEKQDRLIWTRALLPPTANRSAADGDHSAVSGTNHLRLYLFSVPSPAEGLVAGVVGCG